jgi:hypothetical protein
MKPWLFTVVLIVSAIGFCGIARAVVLNNGIVAITNDSSDSITIYLEHAWNEGHFIETRVTIAPRQTWLSSGCCFAAGSPYQLRVTRNSRGNPNPLYHKFTPHLCNRNGIPYGFYEVTVNGNNSFRSGDERACYEGPL